MIINWGWSPENTGVWYTARYELLRLLLDGHLENQTNKTCYIVTPRLTIVSTPIENNVWQDFGWTKLSLFSQKQVFVVLSVNIFFNVENGVFFITYGFVNMIDFKNLKMFKNIFLDCHLDVGGALKHRWNSDADRGLLVGFTHITVSWRRGKKTLLYFSMPTNNDKNCRNILYSNPPTNMSDKIPK